MSTRAPLTVYRAPTVGAGLYRYMFVVLLVFWACVAPVVPEDTQKYLALIYVPILFLILVSRRWSVPKFRGATIFVIYLFVQILTLFLHVDAALNLAMLVVSAATLGMVAYRVSGDVVGAERVIEITLAVSLLLMFVESSLLTAVGWSTAPELYPWQALLARQRLLLIRGTVGHTANTWYAALLSLYVARRIGRGATKKVGLSIALILLFVCLVATRNRLSLLYILLALNVLLAFRKVPFARASLIAWPIVACIAFVALAYAPQFELEATAAADALQARFPDLRIAANPRAPDVTSGRIILNQALLKQISRAPWTGVGPSAPILLYGVTKQGVVAEGSSEKISRTESAFRLAVKYGWPYYAAVVMLIMAPLISTVIGRHSFDVMAVAVSQLFLMSFVFEGGMEQLYSVSAVMLLMVLVYYFSTSSRRRVAVRGSVLDMGTSQVGGYGKGPVAAQ